MQSAEKVRKQFILDPGKLQTVKRITNAPTDTEAVNRALDMVIANEKVRKALESAKGKGKIEDVFGRLSA